MSQQNARQDDEQRRATALTREQLPAYLVRLGARYERAALARPRDYDTMTAAEALLARLHKQHEETDCGLLFRRGQNVIRKARGLETVAAW
jgi:hypothetical protein